MGARHAASQGETFSQQDSGQARMGMYMEPV